VLVNASLSAVVRFLPFFCFLVTLNQIQALQISLSALSTSVLFSSPFILLPYQILLTLTVMTFSV